MTKITTAQAIALLERSDCVILETSDLSTVSNHVGYQDESDPNSDFVVGAEGWDDIHIKDPEWDPASATMFVADFAGSLTLYIQLRDQA